MRRLLGVVLVVVFVALTGVVGASAPAAAEPAEVALPIPAALAPAEVLSVASYQQLFALVRGPRGAHVLAVAADGRRHAAFGTGGVVQLRRSGAPLEVRSGLLGTDPNGVVGLVDVAGAPRRLLFRYMADGSPDPEFGRGGSARFPSAVEQRSIVGDGTGILFLLGTDGRVTRVQGDGVVDPAFDLVDPEITRLLLVREGRAPRPLGRVGRGLRHRWPAHVRRR
jgi:hypothetical protein